MSKSRIATLDCEKLSVRYKFMSNVSQRHKKECAGGQIKFHEFKGTQRKITVKITKAAKADTIELKRVGNRTVLKNSEQNAFTYFLFI